MKKPMIIRIKDTSGGSWASNGLTTGDRKALSRMAPKIARPIFLNPMIIRNPEITKAGKKASEGSR
jgi:hypothetical protein